MKELFLDQITRQYIGKNIDIYGWVDRLRNLGGLIFIDIRDRRGTLQVVIDPQKLPAAKDLGLQYCIHATGTVRARPLEQINPDMATGEVEVAVEELEVLNASKVPPFVITDDVKANEELRLRYRYLDLRRAVMQKVIRMRHEVIAAMREYLNDKNFVEIETPLLTRSMPEGARDYLVPSRLYPQKFYALAQSPQMYKQLLMIAGYERYYQVARCMRDEDPRHDRQPEHTQIDIEMSFVNEDDVMAVVEGMFAHIFQSVLKEKLIIPFPRMTYGDALERYGTDKPDLRIGMEIQDMKAFFHEKSFPPFQDVKAIRGILVKKGQGVSRKRLEVMHEKAKKMGLRGIFWAKREDKISGSIAKIMDVATADNSGLRPGDLLLIAAGDEKVLKFLGELRLELGHELEQYEPGFRFLWVYDFPIFELDEKSGALTTSHHIFTQPRREDMHYLDGDPLRVRGRLYDLVCNGNELASGSIRNHLRSIQEKMFTIAGMDPEKYTMLLEALDYGAPPHGGIAPGIDRIVMILAGLHSLRDVIAFPKTTTAQGLLEGIPDEVTPEQLKELNITFEKKESAE